ncbi:MAG: deoxynucleoside kinase [Bacteroidia bacterium]|nr:deoxynucleoside kinase [Bacteroidia bacterium]
MRPSFIAIEGNIGAGKSTLAAKLALHLKAELLEEKFEENPLLPSFYLDAAGYAYPLELSLLIDRFRDIKKRVIPGRPVVADYWFNKSLIFARTNLSREDFAHFMKLFTSLEFKLPVPDLVIYYHRSPEKASEGIRERGREYEQGIPGKYLEKLEKQYLSYLKQYRKSPVLWLDGERFAPARNREDMSRLLKLLDTPFKPGLNRPDLGI